MILHQYYNLDTEDWIKTLTIDGVPRYRFTSPEPNEGELTAYDGQYNRAFSNSQIRNFRIGSVEFTPIATDATNAYEAELRCRKQGGHLAFFRTRSEYEQYRATVDIATSWASTAWIGAQRIGNTEKFINVDGTEPYLDWYDGEPTESGDVEGCVVLEDRDGIKKMNDIPCYDAYSYSCRIDSPPQVKT